MVCEDTLRIKNLPNELSVTEKEDFLRHFGAVKVKIITSKAKQKSVAFAKFENKEIAKGILFRLHQLTILNCRLCVEYAENDIGSSSMKANSVVNANSDSGEYFQQFLKRLNSWNVYSFHQPPPSHLKYSYPKANRATIGNIAHALASVPKFYTQVLHLMNKMNLPAPFSSIPDSAFTQQILRSSTQRNSSDESEIESDDDSTNKLKDIIPVKRKLGQRKTIKRPKFMKPNPQYIINKETQNVDSVFDRVSLQMQPKIQLKLSTELSENNDETYQSNNIGENVNTKDTENKNVNIILSERADVITSEELKKGKLSPEEFKKLPVFKDYNPGIPAAKLYIKNIAKAVEIKDLEYIYERYHTRIVGAEDMFNIKLMKEGRMKGQAFITFNTIESAVQALEETNGYVLKDKTLVVMFAKSAAQKS